MTRILIVDDEPGILKTLKSFLSMKGYEVVAAESVESARATAAESSFDVAILDVYVGTRNGLDLLKGFRASQPDLPVIMISGHADIATAVQAIRAGAFDFIEKPLDTDRLEIVLKNAIEAYGSRRAFGRMKDRWLGEHFCAGVSPAMRNVAELAEKAGGTDATVLLFGPSGTGKEILAQLVYLSSARADKAFVTVNCPAIPEDLFESELFGHRKGSFTGATSDREGYFHRAAGGTLFLDEIGELPLKMQPKLLRALESREIQPVGSSATETVDVRIIAATNRDLDEAVKKGDFRQDLYYRLCRIPIRIPSLDERKEDIPALASFFLDEVALRSGTRRLRLSREAEAYLIEKPWPGNVRELRTALERAAVFCDGDTLDADFLRALEGMGRPGQAAEPPIADGSALAPMPGGDDPFEETVPYKEASRIFETRYLEVQLKKHGGSVKKTAEKLGLLPNNLSRKIAELGISRTKSENK